MVSSLEIGESNRLKNMMLDTWDGQIWYPRFYDMDTICSYNNSGEIKFDVDIEMEQGYWNTSSSRLWTKVRDLMHDELVETYKDMRQNGMTFDSFMECFYGDQISKIPQKYYNKDYDVKYAPYSDQYIGKAHGDGYQHLKRWLKNRLIFTDTLFDYAPSYENDVLTIRANTLDKIDITIETYTPVYQHLSWYNGQMSKEKIVPGQSFTFSGNVQASTDQEILIYGGSNIKKITGISSANPNELIIGNAPRLTELVATNCPLLTTINSNKANLSAHTYLNKLDLSGCSQLGGILQLHNSQLIQDINMKDTAITGLQMPKSLRNLKVLRLPNTITELVLNDAPLLHTIELDEGNALQSISLLNCNKLDNCINFDLTKVPTISLDNSYNTEELYMSATTNLTLKNMPSLQRVIFTPNSEYSAFDINNVLNGANYKITTFNNPMMTDFITTAQHRLSYKNGEYGDITPNTAFTANTLDLADTQFQNVKFLCTTDIYNLKVPTSMKNFYCDSAFDIDTDVIEEASYEVIHEELIEPYTTNYDKNVYRYNHETVTKTICVDGTPSTEINGYDEDNEGESMPGRENYYGFNYTQIVPGSTITISQSGDNKIKLYDENKVYISGSVKAGNEPITYVTPNNAHYFRFSSWRAYGTITYESGEPYTPNIIPSSANGSLIFNMYSNNTTQPTSTSPYMWDLTGLKLNDFYTYGMNNNVKPSEESVKRISNIPFIYGATPNSTAGNPITFRVDVYQCMFVLRVEPGEVYSFTRINDTDGTAPYYGFGDSYYDSSWNTVYVNPGYTAWGSGTVTVPEGAVYAIFTPKYIMEYNRPYINKKHYIPIGDGSYLHVTPTEDCAYSYTTANFSNSAVLDAVKSIVSTPTGGNSVLVTTPTSITMPQRMPGYSVRLVNADITPDEYPTMLYPKWIDTGLPITGKLDYTAYNGTSLAWAYAYTTGDVSINPLDSRSIGQITNDYNKLYGTDFVDIVDIWAYKDDDFSSKSTNEAITKAYIELTSANYKTRIDEVLQWYPNCTDLYLFDDGSVTTLMNLLNIANSLNTNSGKQIKHLYFMEGYFKNLTDIAYIISNQTAVTHVYNVPNNIANMSDAFFYAGSLQYVSNIPTACTNMTTCFSGCKELTTAPAIPQGVTNMYRTFQDCTSLTTAPAIPQGVTNMQQTFNGCTSLTTAPIIPQGVTNMNSTFYGCTSLTTASTIPSSVTIMNSTFWGCASLTTAPTISSGVTSMYETFRGCTSLTTAPNIPSSVTSLEKTFQGCSKLTTAPVIPSSVTSMNGTFYGCTSLTTVPNIPNSVTNMNSTFQDCTSLTQAPSIPDSVTNIQGCFQDCSILKTVYIPLSNTTAYANAISTWGGATPSLEDIIWVGERNTDFVIYGGLIATNSKQAIPQADIKELVNNHLADLTSQGTTATLTLGETYGAYLTPGEVFSANQKGWTIVGASNDFTIVNANTDISTLTTDESVLSCFIELTNDNYKTRVNEALQWYPNCTDLYFFEDGTVTTLADMFNNSNNNTYKSKIKKIEFMDGYFQNLTSLNYSFYNCTALTDISNIPSSVENMYRAFYYCGSLVNVSDLPDGVTNVDYTFYQCDSLVTAPKLGKSATVLDYTFYGCDKLQSIPEFPPNVTKLTGTFSGCSKLTSVPDIPNSVTDMSNAFYNCSRLVVAPKLPNSVNTLSSTFQGCSSLQTPPSIIPKSVTNASGCFNGCTSLVTPPEFEHVDGSDLYAGRMYQNCSKMTTAPKIPNGVNNILGMFVGCSALTIPPTIPDSVTNMQETFSNCTGLTQNPNVPTGVINLKYAFSNSSITAITIPLTNLTTYDYAISKCPNLTDVTWVGELTSTFNVKNLYYRSATDNTTPTATDIQELVPEHLGTVTGETLTLGDYISYLTEDEIAQAVAKGWTIQ